MFSCYQLYDQGFDGSRKDPYYGQSPEAARHCGR
jgi:hypothetical protein